MDLFLKIIFTLLLFFTPFSFAGAEPWAFCVVQCTLFLLTLALLFSRRHLLHTPALKAVTGIGVVLVGVGLLQLCFPATLLNGPQARPVTLSPLLTVHQLSFLITWFTCVWTVTQLYPSFEETRSLVRWVCVAAGAVALCAFCMPGGEYIRRLTGVQGGIGPFMNRNHAGIFFALSSMGSLGLFWVGQVGYHKLLSHRQKRLFQVRQGSLAMLFVLLAAAVFYTRSRGAMLAWLCGIFTYCFLCFWAIPPQLKKRLKGVFFTLVVLLLTAGWIATHTVQINAYAQRGTGASEQTRKMLYRAATRALGNYPLFGVGIGAMPVMITSYTEWELPAYVSHLHSDWLEILLGVGTIGGGLLVLAGGWLIAIWLARLKKLPTKKQFLFAGLLSGLMVMAVGCGVDYHFFIPADTLVFCSFAGLLCSPTFYHHHTHQVRRPLWLGGVATVMLLACTYMPLKYTLAWRLFLFGDGFKTTAKLETYEQGLVYYPAPHFALRTARAYYNAAARTEDPVEAWFYRQEAHRVAETFLKKYPKDKKLSKIYLRTFQ